MRSALFWNPRIICERLAVASQRYRRLAKLKRTAAASCNCGQISTLELLELVRRQPPRTIYDIGACVGTWSLLAHACFPGAEVHAFEPLPTHHAVFEKNIATLPNIHLHKTALGRHAEHMKIHVASFSDASSLLPLAEPMDRFYGIKTQREESVPVVRLDDYRETQRLPPPDFLKLDVQGYELSVLEGAPQSLKEAQWVLLEVSFVPFYQGQPLFAEIVAFMNQNDFDLFGLSADTVLGQELMQTDALFIRKALRR